MGLIVDGDVLMIFGDDKYGKDITYFGCKRMML